MDDAARLVSELHVKLTELDGKVAAYQRDMLAEFHKHLDECLKKYPNHVSSEISRAIAESMSKGRYPALSPTARDVPDSPAIDRNARDGRKSPPPILRHTSGTPKESPRSPHARETEFQGLFTPTYLPLLEHDDRAYRSPPMSPPPTSEGPALALSTANLKKVEETKQAVLGGHDSRRVAVRRLTDMSSSSFDSSSSDSKVRRSALRRSSSSIKGSSRRVRFEFEGEEVFPASSSPQAPATTLALESGEEFQPEEAETPAALATENESAAAAYAGTSLLDVEGEEDWLPRPRKVSSTQALQALTRSPLEEGTVWTQVDPDPDAEEPAKMNGEKQPASARDRPSKVDSQATIRANGAEGGYWNGQLGSHMDGVAVDDDDDDEDENASDDEFLSMRPKGKSPSPAATTPFARPSQGPATASAASSSRTTPSEPNGTGKVEDDQDPFFNFDDEGGPATSPSQKYLPDAESDDEDTPSPGQRTAAREPSGEASAAQAVPFSPSAALFGHSIGSYMGKSMTINPIKDPKLYDEIASMKDVHLFVGSMKDAPFDVGSLSRGAAAAANGGLGSYTASSFARGATMGGPRSFTERLALEDEMERRRAAGEDHEI
ncbi:hypothetical protein C8A00DRAFT_46658 [Chaetomidium leptoderma]|uniref:Uncharacterized protein n=1 Tax=Chaetomidium leptoderma TaxID=669021 RepID=A0AAN6VEF2_9PEZI|nr:hypothetical protein C8A00DRAFT_46658 [Chaetomidium leptoderma]